MPPLDKLWNWSQANWLLLVPLALGFFAVYLLLPQGRRATLFLGVLLGLGALAIAGLLWVQPSGPVIENILFYTFAGIAVISGVCMITQQNPVYAALWFALVILSTCGLFILQSAPFLATATIIVYAGAIIVTFLFVIMLAQQTGLATYDRVAREPLLASLAGFVLLGALLYTLQMTHGSVPISSEVASARSTLSQPTDAGHVASLGRSLFTDYLWAVELAGTLLLAATIGAIAISARRTEVLR